MPNLTESSPEKQGTRHWTNSLQERTAKITALLPVLSHPNLLLDNNAAELATRRKVRKRDVCFHTISAEGTRVQDAYLAIIETAQKLGVSAFEYLTYFLAGSRKMTPLPKLIALKLSGHPIGF